MADCGNGCRSGGRDGAQSTHPRGVAARAGGTSRRSCAGVHARRPRSYTITERSVAALRMLLSRACCISSTAASNSNSVCGSSVATGTGAPALPRIATTCHSAPAVHTKSARVERSPHERAMGAARAPTARRVRPSRAARARSAAAQRGWPCRPLVRRSARPAVPYDSRSRQAVAMRSWGDAARACGTLECRPRQPWSALAAACAFAPEATGCSQPQQHLG
jgi:hypothetical protein